VGARAGLDGWGKSRLPLGFDPRSVQPVASRYTDCALSRFLTGTESLLRISIITPNALIFYVFKRAVKKLGTE